MLCRYPYGSGHWSDSGRLRRTQSEFEAAPFHSSASGVDHLTAESAELDREVLPTDRSAERNQSWIEVVIFQFLERDDGRDGGTCAELFRAP